MKTIQEVLAQQRIETTPDMEIALQDFLELPPMEQQQMLFIGLLAVTKQAEWIQNTLVKMVDTLNK